MKPTSTPTDALLDEIQRSMIFHPDAAFDVLERSAQERVHELLDAHLRALEPFEAEDDRAFSLEIAFTRSRIELCEAWMKAWEGRAGGLWWGRPLQCPRTVVKDHQHGAGRGRGILEALGSTWWATAKFPLEERRVHDRRLREAYATMSERSACTSDVPIAELLGLEYSWRLTRSEQSPWQPLWSLWQYGVWPVWLGAKSWLVYVPTYRDDELVEPFATRASPREVREMARTSAPYSLVEAGLAPIGRVFDQRRACFIDLTNQCSMPLGATTALGRIPYPQTQIAMHRGNCTKMHARVEVRDQHYVIIDYKCGGGTFVNGRRAVVPTVLQSGDRVAISNFVFTFRDAPSVDADELARGLCPPGLLCLYPESFAPETLLS